MNQQTVSIEKGTFKSPLVPITAVMFAAAAVFSALAVGTLFHPASIPAIISDMELGQIYDPNAQRTWLVIYIAVMVVNCLGALVLAAGLFLVLMGRHYVGTDLLYKTAKWTLKGVNISGAAALVYFIFRAVRYIVLCCQVNGGTLPLFSMVLMEGLMGTQAWILFIKLRQFLECAMDAAASVGYTLTTDKLNAPTIPAFSATGFLVLALFNIGIALDRFFTFVHIQKNLSVTYEFPIATEPVQILSGTAFAFAAAGCLLMFFYLRGYKNKSERLLLRSLKNALL